MSRLTSGVKYFALLAVMVALPAAAEAQPKPMDVEKLNDNISQYTGKKVAVAGEVEDLLGPRSFVLESGGIFDDEIAVVVPPALQQRLPAEDANVVVTGTVRSLSVVELERELDWDLTPEFEAEFEGVKHFLVADNIEPQRR